MLREKDQGKTMAQMGEDIGKESLSAIGSQAEAQNSPVINTLMSSHRFWDSGSWEANVSGSAHPSGRKSCGADWIVFWLSNSSGFPPEAVAYSLTGLLTVAYREKLYNGLTLPSFLPNPHWNICTHVQRPAFFQVNRDPQTL